MTKKSQKSSEILAIRYNCLIFCISKILIRLAIKYLHRNRLLQSRLIAIVLINIDIYVCINTQTNNNFHIILKILIHRLIL